jgi:hypothetical protein
MPKYQVTMTVEFMGEIEASSVSDAEQKAWTAWGENSDALLTYSGVDSIDVDEIEEEDEDEEDN